MLSIRSRGTILSFVLVLPLLTACGGDEPEETEIAPPVTEAPAEGDMTVAPQEIASHSEAYGTAWNQDDPAALAAFFTEDATVTAGDSTYTGREEIEQDWIAPATPAISDLTVSDAMYHREGDQITESGRFSYTATAEDGSTQQATGTFTHVWVQDTDGTWRIREAEVQPDA